MCWLPPTDEGQEGRAGRPGGNFHKHARRDQLVRERGRITGSVREVDVLVKV
jgi:hypothetical protein